MDSSKGGAERRRFHRIDRRSAVVIEVGSKVLKVVLLNLSECGLLIQSPEGFAPGTILQVPMNLGARKTVKVEGTVRWMSRVGKVDDSFAMGIELSAAPAAYLKAVADLRKSSREKSTRGPEERFEIYHRVSFQSGENFLSEYTENISRGGMYIATKAPIALGSIIQAKLDLPGEVESMTVEGRVTYCLDALNAAERGRTPGVGIQFVNLSESVRNRINHYIQRLTVHRSTANRRWTGPVPRSGSLNDFLVPELLVNLSADSTGVLVLKKEEIQKKVFFEKGKVVWVESQLPSESLGQYFSARGLIPLEKLSEFIQIWHQTDSVLAQRLIDAGIMDADTVLETLVQCIEDRLIHTFTWFDGSFQFQDGVDWKTSIVILPIQINRVIFEGVTKWYDAKLISAWMGLDERTRVRSRLPSAIKELPETAYRIIHASWGEQSLKQISEELTVSLDTLIPSIYALVIAGWMELVFTNDTLQPSTRKPAKAVTPKVALKPNVKELKDRVDTDFERLKKLDYFELLGVTKAAKENEISQAYEKRVARYSEADSKSDKVAQILSWLSIARDTLMSPALRSMYLKAPSSNVSEENAIVSFELDRELLSSMSEIQSKEYRAALERLSPLVEKHPSHAAIRGWYGWALFCDQGSAVLGQSLTLIDRAIHLDPSDPHLYFFFGRLWLEQKELKKAEHAFLQAVRLQANFSEAHEALKRVRSRIET